MGIKLLKFFSGFADRAKTGIDKLEKAVNIDDNTIYHFLSASYVRPCADTVTYFTSKQHCRRALK